VPSPRVCVLRAPGTNCDVETAFAFESCGATAERVHLFRLLEKPQLLSDYQVLCIPGGFSYGDDIGAGVIFSRQLRGALSGAIGEFLTADKLVLGICNGFQVLLKAGILPAGGTAWPPNDGELPEATLTWNNNGKYTAIWVKLAGGNSKSVFLRDIDSIDLPVAHAEGRIVPRDESVLTRWAEQGQIAFRYRARKETPQLAAVGAGGNEPLLPYPENPNGSIANIAGLCDPTGRVLGLMPHPERFLFATQHPQWTRKRLTGDGDGRKIFQNAVDYFA
jgi:phosphoribosylformylglycinamidine synthase subunit PurQ / glutaminase